MTTPPYPLLPKPMKRSWLERHPLWKIPVGCLTLLLLIAVFGSIVITVITESFRQSDVYKQAMVFTRQNLEVREQIGEPIKAEWFVSGQLNVNGSTGNANLAIPISGPRGNGVIRAVAYKSDVWRFTSLQISIAGRPGVIDLLSVQPPAEREF